jgi:hypothetical protein
MLPSPTLYVVCHSQSQSTDSQDIDYIKKYYTIEFDESQAVTTVGGRDDSARYAKGEKEFQPMYMIKQVPADPKLLVSILCDTCSSLLIPLGNVFRLFCFPIPARQDQALQRSHLPDHLPQQQGRAHMAERRDQEGVHQ